ncbi:N-acetylmuramoyl-L-alanine amidase [Desulfosporosinus nitroreducens]|uniref:N-acetylmuramoyl-L-alanine amidase n=1 Tax=Desulfosporosinus nitroreducens TaxID=2018668 RepID=A0ABT8QN82_9FIRM|nr:N-acetylmuramoyl-L-alanine amidase [Desulfosporosinus nitroreducens]MDO0822801.1 N-acetylmuramoyl-L-alanine amidase [Desulfosporosinus nitroreducens]
MSIRPIILIICKPWILAGIIILLILFIGAGSLKLTSAFSSSLKDKVIVIDPGHGGADPGAQNSGLKEKEINLDISLRLGKVLESKGCKVILTREVDRDFFLPGFVKGRMAKRAELNTRIKIATENNADLFISVHANSFPQRNSYGMETYYHLKSAAGKALAEIIHEKLTQVQPDNKRIAKAGDYYIINQAEMPSVIVEVGFISNPRERKLLLSEDYRNLVADAIGAGVEHYFQAFPQGVQENSPTAGQEGPPTISENTYKLYFSNENLDSLVPEDRQINKSVWTKLNLSQKASLVMSELIQGPLSSKLTPTIAPTTRLLSVTTQNGLATIDFSKDIRDDFPGGASGEDMAIKSIIWSMTQIPGITSVRILVNGEFGDSIGGHILLDRTFSTQLGV